MSDRTSGCPNKAGLEMWRPRDEARSANATNSLTIVTEFVALHLPAQNIPAKVAADRRDKAAQALFQGPVTTSRRTKTGDGMLGRVNSIELPLSFTPLVAESHRMRSVEVLTA